MNTDTAKLLRDLRRKLSNHFNLSELQILTFDLSVDWDSLSGDTREVKSQDLISYLSRRGRLSDLVVLLKEERPNVDWLDIPPAEEQIEIAYRELLSQYTQLGESLLLATDLYERKRIWRVIGTLDSKLQETESRLSQPPQKSLKDEKHRIYKEYLQVLLQEYEIVNNQISMTLDHALIKRMERKVASMEVEIISIEKILTD